MREDFRPIIGFEVHYEINSEGVVISVKRGKRKLMEAKTTYQGYRSIMLTMNGKRYTKCVHRLVWETFNGEIKDGLLVLHGAKTTRDNCCLENLSLGTQEDNLGRDRRRDRTTPEGERNHSARLTEVQVRYIKKN